MPKEPYVHSPKPMGNKRVLRNASWIGRLRDFPCLATADILTALDLQRPNPEAIACCRCLRRSIRFLAKASNRFSSFTLHRTRRLHTWPPAAEGPCRGFLGPRHPPSQKSCSLLQSKLHYLWLMSLASAA